MITCMQSCGRSCRQQSGSTHARQQRCWKLLSKTNLFDQELHQCSLDAAHGIHLLELVCHTAFSLKEEGCTVSPAEPAAAEQLFELTGTVLKAAGIACSSSFADRLRCSGCVDSKRVLLLVATAIDTLVRVATEQQDVPAVLRLLLHGRLLWVFGMISDTGSS